MDKIKKVYLYTWGCQMNFHDSEKIMGLLQEEGFSCVNNPKEADLIVFNTCSIRKKAEHKFLSQVGRIKHLKKSKPKIKIVVAGCIAQQMGETLIEKMPFIDYVIGPQNISKVKEIIKKDTLVLTEDNPLVAETDLPTVRKKGISAWVNIIYGCNNFCSYCIVPYTRGRERSRPLKNIIKEIKELVSEGFKEVTLLGQNVNSYKAEVSFPELLKLVNKIKGLERIRFVTSHPKDFSDDLIEAIKHLDKVCEHIHLPLQSGSDRILKLMNRKYSFSEYIKKIEKLRTAIPEIAITTDIIAGFPSETEKDHKATINALKEIEFDGIFAFKFSPRPMTKASSMDEQIPEDIKSQRLLEILRLQDSITDKKNKSLIGTYQEVLVEESINTLLKRFIGRTRTNKIVDINTLCEENITPGMLIKVKITEAHRHSLKGFFK